MQDSEPWGGGPGRCTGDPGLESQQAAINSVWATALSLRGTGEGGRKAWDEFWSWEGRAQDRVARGRRHLL